MRYTTFGRRTGLRVSEYGLGTGNFGTARSTGAEPAACRAMFERFADAGGTLIDTSDSYQNGQAEAMVGELVGRDRDHFVVATKFSSSSNGVPRISTTGNSRKHMVGALEASLGRLGTDYVDLYWVHFPDGLTPMDEILRTIDDLTATGKILHAGLSNFPAWRVARAATMAELRGWSPIVGIQVEYSLAERSAERELLPMAEALGLGVGLWAPLAGGLLTGKYRSGQSAGRLAGQYQGPGDAAPDQKTRVVDEVVAVAGETAATPSQVAMAWLRARARASATTLVPIVGPRTVEQLDDYVASLTVVLDDSQLRRLDEVSAIVAGVPHDIMATVAPVAVGGDPTIIDGPIVPVA